MMRQYDQEQTSLILSVSLKAKSSKKDNFKAHLGYFMSNICASIKLVEVKGNLVTALTY